MKRLCEGIISNLNLMHLQSIYNQCINEIFFGNPDKSFFKKNLEGEKNVCNKSHVFLQIRITRICPTKQLSVSKTCNAAIGRWTEQNIETDLNITGNSIYDLKCHLN